MSLFKSLVMLVLAAVSQFCSANQSIDDIQALIAKDAPLALQQANELWQGKVASEANLSLGLLMINALMANKQFEEAKAIIEPFLNLSPISDHARAKILAEKLILIRQSKNGESTDAVVEEGQMLLEKLNSPTGEGAIDKATYALSEAIGYHYYFSGSFAQSEPFFMQALKNLSENQIKEKSNILNTIGVVKAQQADLAGGAEYMLKAIEIMEQHDLPVDFTRYKNLGALNFNLKKWDKSIEYSQKSLSMQTETNAISASLLSNMAAAYIEKGELDVAIELLNESIAISTSLGMSTASARNNLGYVYNQVGKYQEALEQLEISKIEFVKEGREEELSVTYKSMGDVYANLQQHAKALNLYEQALALHKMHDFKLKRVELYPKIIDVLVKKNDYQRAYELMTEFKSLNDEITDVESTAKVNELLAAFEIEKKERALIDSELERAKQQNEIALLEHNAAFNEKLKLLMLALLIGLVVILLLIYRSWRFRGRVNQLLLDKNQRIEEQHLQLKTLNEQLKNQTEIDTLTGLKNRRFLTQLIAREIATNKVSQKHWCLIIIDLDDFKQINDRYGHQRGDEVLVKFAKLLEASKSSGDVMARWGGEEFLWLTEIDSVNAGTQKCDAFQAALTKEPWFRDDEIQVTCSMGFSSFPLISLCFEDWEAALRLADYAMYQAKNSGKNNWHGFEVLDHKFDYTEIKHMDKLLNNHHVRQLRKL